MIIIKDLVGIQDLEQKQITKIVGGGTDETGISGSSRYSYKVIDLSLPYCPLTLLPNGTIGHRCSGEP